MNYLIGLFLGDGYISLNHKNKDGSNYYILGLVASEDNYAEIKSVCDFSNEKVHLSEGYKYYELWCHDQMFIKEISDKCGFKCRDKKLPKLNKDEFFETLSGLIDSDGGVRADNLYFRNTNKNLIDSISYELDRYEIKHSVSIYKQTDIRYSDLYEILFSQQTIGLVDVNLRIKYKREKLNKLKKKSRGLYKDVTKEFILENYEFLKKKYKKQHLDRVLARDKYKIKYEYYEELINNR